MNNLQHGMRSTKDLLPGESAEERQKLQDGLYAAVKPRDAVEELLTDRVVKTAWFVRRGERARDALATKAINTVVEGAGDHQARRVEVLAAEIDESPDALRQLRTFPEGVAYLKEQFSILREVLAQGFRLQTSHRRRCFSLVGKKCEDVLRDDRVATWWFLAQLGMKYDSEMTVEEMQAELGSDPPDWMCESEFVNRAEGLRRVVPAQAVGRELLATYILAEIEALDARSESVKARAERDLKLDVTEASVVVTPEGKSLANYIDKSDKSCLAALRRLEARQKPTPDRPGSKRNPKTAEAATEVGRARVEPGRAKPANVAAEAQDPVAANPSSQEPAPAPVAATTTEAEGRAPENLTVEAISEPVSVEPAPENLTVEAISEPVSIEPAPENLTVEAISELASVEPAPENLTVEAISEPVSIEPAPENLTVEAISELASVEPAPENLTVEAISELASVEPAPENLTVEAISEPVSIEPAPNKLTVEAISELASVEPAPENLTVEAISELASVEPAPENLTVEAISEPASIEPAPNKLTVEAISELASVEPAPNKLTVEAISEPEPSRPFGEPFGIDGNRPDPARPPPVADG